MVSMIQAIRDLADAFVPSGKLIELVDHDLVSLVCMRIFLNGGRLLYTCTIAYFGQTP